MLVHDPTKLLVRTIYTNELFFALLNEMNCSGFVFLEKPAVLKI